jgi:hypothetical protein
LERQLEPVLPWHDAAACAPSAAAPTRLVPAHCPFFAPVHAVREKALLIPPGAAARALPEVWVLQPVPKQPAVTSVMPLAAYPPVVAWQAPAVLHVAVEVPLTLAAPTAFVFDDVRVAQPPFVPLSQVAVIEAVVVANRLSVSTLGTVDAVEEFAVICAWQAVLPSHRVVPVAVLALRRAFGPAPDLTSPVSVPVQPASGQWIWEVACAVPE